MLELPLDGYTELDGYQRTKFIKTTLTAWYARRVATGRCLTFTELSNSTGMALGRFIDFYVLHLLAMDDWRTVAYEVKISRSDFLQELKQPKKRAPALKVSNEFYFATPVGLIRLDELPDEAGLIEVYPSGAIRVRKPAPRRKIEAAPWGFVAALARKVSLAGGQVKL